MKKKGFTLIELLAVIAILAIIVVIALPNVVSLFNNAKKDSFTTELKEIYKTAINQWMSDTLNKTYQISYGRYTSDLDCIDRPLELSGRQEILYGIVINKGGKVINFVATDNTYYYSYTAENDSYLKIEDINTGDTTNKVIKLADIGKFEAKISCTTDRTYVISPE